MINLPPSQAAQSDQWPWSVIGFTALYMVAAVVGAVVSGNKEFLFYIVMMLVMIGIVALLHSKSGLSPGVLWALSIWGALHMAGGLVPTLESWPINGDQHVLYSLWFIPGYLKYDHLVHAFGFGTTTIVCWQALEKQLPIRSGESDVLPTWGMMILVVAAGMGFGALNEVIEFAATLLIPNTNVGGYENTGWDLVSNLAGCILAALLIRFRASVGSEHD